MDTGKVTEHDTLEDSQKEEQERTRLKKLTFIHWFGQTRGVVAACCDKAEISRETYYRWRREDPMFVQALKEVEVLRNDEVEDLLMGKIHIEKDGPSIRYYLDRKHPAYKPKTRVEKVITADKTIEDLLDEGAERKIDHEQQSHTRGTDSGNAEQPQTGGVSPQDSQ